MINVIAAIDQIRHIRRMLSTKRHRRREAGMSAGRFLQIWLMAFVILLAGVTQSGVVPALLNGQNTGVSGALAATAAPGSNVLLICTPAGIKTFNLVSGDAVPSDDLPEAAGHGFCSLCATHHGAVAVLDLPYGAPVTVAHNVAYGAANGIATDHDIPRIRHSRAPPLSV